MFTKGITGLEWTASGLKYVSLKNSMRNREPSSSGVFYWPESITTPMNPLSCLESLKTFVKRFQLNGQLISLSLPRSEFFLKWKKVPNIDPEPIEKVVAEEFPLPLSQLCWDYQSIVIDDETTTFLFGGIAKDKLRTYQQALEKAGLTLKIAGVNFLAQIKALSSLNRYARPHESLVLLDVDLEQTQMTFLSRSRPVFCRSLSVGGETLKANEAKEISTELKKALLYLKTENRLDAVHRIELLGEGSKSIELKRTLKDDFEIPVGTELFDKWFFLAGAYGQALSAVDPNVLSVSPPIEQRLVKQKATKKSIGIGVAVLCLSFLGHSWLSNEIEQKRKDLQILDRKIRNIQSIQAVTKRIKTSDQSAVELLSSITNKIPKGSHLVHYQYDLDKNNIELKGRSSSYSHVSGLIKALGEVKNLKGIQGEKSRLIEVAGRRVVEFLVKGSLE